MKLRNLKKVVSVVLLGTMLLSCHAEAVNVQWNGETKEDIDLTITAGSGKCGDNMTWELDENGTLTISGNGKMYNYVDYDKGVISFPWLEKNNEAAITSVNIEDGVESISAGTLFGTSVKKVTIPNSVKEIGNDAISNCKNLKEIILSDNIETLSEGVFNYDTSLPRIKLPQSLKEIHMYAFLGCSSLKDIVLPENVTEIGERAFANCTSLETIVIPPSVTSITTTSFQNAAGLKKVLLPPGVKVIEAAAFLGCANIEEIILPDGLEKIEHNAFTYSDTPRTSESRQKVYIPASVTQIDNKSPFSENVIIYGFKNSTAETYAKEMGMEFVEVSESMYDANSYKEAYYSQFQSKFEKLLVKNGNKLSISLDNIELNFEDAEPFIDKNGRTQVPVYALAEPLGLKLDWEVAWNGSSKAVLTSASGDIVKITIGSNVMTANNKEIIMDTEAVIIDDRTYIPVRFVAEALGLTVEWTK